MPCGKNSAHVGVIILLLIIQVTQAEAANYARRAIWAFQETD